jgi:hypothetical protein
MEAFLRIIVINPDLGRHQGESLGSLDRHLGGQPQP